MKEELFRIENADVYWRGNIKLQNFSMEIIKSEILGIYSKNFAEIDCLIDILRGVIKPASGRIIFKGSQFNNKVDVNIVVISKVSQLIDSFTVSDNIFVIRKGFKKYIINRKTLEIQTDIMLKKLGINILPNTLIHELSQLEKIIIEITKAYILRIPIVILKNLSSFLSDKEINNLYPYIKLFKNVGVTFLVMDSAERLLEMFCTRVLLINKGRNIWIFRQGDFSENILQNFFNIDKELTSQNHNNISGVYDYIKIDNLRSNNLNGLSLSMKKGEILGLVDLEGSQIEGIKEIIFGQNSNFKGNIFINNTKLLSPNPLKLLDLGVAIIDEDPSNKNLFKTFNAIDNLAFPLSHKVFFFWQNRRYRKNIIRKYSHFFTDGALRSQLRKLETADLHSLAYLRWHLYNPEIIVLIRPFSSVDRQLEKLTLTLIDLLVKKGIGVIILTSNLWELSALSATLPINIQRLSPSI